jgi:hypothetical protein
MQGHRNHQTRSRLDPRVSVNALRSLLVLYANDGMKARPVGLWVNNSKHDGPKCIEPAVA